MINLNDVIRQLESNGEAVRALTGTISDEEAQWKADPETWSLAEVLSHLYDEERIDFRRHLRDEFFSAPPQPWKPNSQVQVSPAAGWRGALEGFLAGREASLAGLRSLEPPNWDAATHPPWGAIAAGDVLVSWVEHDFLHMRQLIEVLYAWNVQQAQPYSVQYAGEW